MTLDEFYALFSQWEEELHRCLQAHKDLEKIVYHPTASPEETLSFLGHGELLRVLHDLLRLRHFLAFWPHNLPGPIRQGLLEHLQNYGHPEVTPVQIWDFFQAWREDHSHGPAEGSPRTTALP